MKRIKEWGWYILFILVLAAVVAFFATLFIIHLTIFLYVLVSVYFVSVISAIIIFLQKRHSSAKLAWLFTIIVLPLAGHILYFTLGQKYPHRKDYIALKSQFRQTVDFEIKKEIKDKNVYETLNQLSWFNRNKLVESKVEPFIQPNDYFNSLLDSIENAKHNIWLISYLVEDGYLFQELANKLIKKKKQGIQIKWLVDDYGRRNLKKHCWHELKKNGIEISFIGQLKFTFFLSSNLYRNHRKSIIIDNEILYNGGSNISDNYISMGKDHGYFKDYNYRIEGEYVIEYAKLFASMWKRWTDQDLSLDSTITRLIPKKDIDSNADLLMVSGGPEINDPILEESIIKLINRAQKNIKIATPYFSITEPLKQAIKIALMSGIEVTLYFPSFSPQKIVASISNFEIEQLIGYGLIVKNTNDFFNHSKVGIFDNKIAYVGSMNFDIRSFYAQYENIDILHGTIVEQISKYFEILEAQSHSKTSNFSPKYLNLPKRILYNMFKPLV